MTDIGWLLLGVNFGLLLFEPLAPWRGFVQLGLPLGAVALFLLSAFRARGTEE